MNRFSLPIFLLFFFLFALNSYSLPACTGYDTTVWDLCIGKHGAYEGEWKDGSRHGKGTFTYASVRKYVGEWKYGDRHGKGTLTWADGSKYVGEYKNNKKHGQGTYTWANGSRWEGPWVEGEFKGEKAGGISSNALAEISDTYLIYNLYDEYCGEYLSSSPLKKALKRFIKVVLDSEKSRGAKFNKKGAKDMGFQIALDAAKNRDNRLNFSLRLGYVGVMSKLEEGPGCLLLRDAQIKEINQFSRLWEQQIKQSKPKKERKRDF